MWARSIILCGWRKACRNVKPHLVFGLVQMTLRDTNNRFILKFAIRNIRYHCVPSPFIFTEIWTKMTHLYLYWLFPGSSSTFRWARFSGLPVKPLVYVKKPKVSIEELYGFVSDDEEEASGSNQQSTSSSQQVAGNHEQDETGHPTGMNYHRLFLDLFCFLCFMWRKPTSCQQESQTIANCHCLSFPFPTHCSINIDYLKTPAYPASLTRRKIYVVSGWKICLNSWIGGLFYTYIF